MRNAPGFGKVGEARSGVVHLTGFPDGPPVHAGFSHADTVTALTAAFGILAASYRKARDPDFSGEWIDLALFEPLFRLIEWQVIVHDQLGVAPGRSGNRLAIAPAAVVNTYLSADDEWITVTSATLRSVQNVARLLGLPPENFRTVEQQVARTDELDDALRTWVCQRSTADALRAMADAEVVASRIFSMNDIAADPTYAERQAIVSVPDDELGEVHMQAAVPKMHSHGGTVWRTGPSLGADNEVVCKQWLGMADNDFDQLCATGVIGDG
jgi:formyl-CoA transferase